jgi:hypothetical protein
MHKLKRFVKYNMETNGRCLFNTLIRQENNFFVLLFCTIWGLKKSDEAFFSSKNIMASTFP